MASGSDVDPVPDAAPRRDPHPALLARVADHATAWLASLEDRPVPPSATVEELAAALGGALPEEPQDPVTVLDDLVRGASPGLSATPGGRFFGFVIGGSLPAAMAADLMTVVWDQNAGLLGLTPAAAVAEQVASGWVLDLLGLPPRASVGYVTGGCMANATCLMAARHHVLAAAGWDVERDGLQGAPRIHVVVGAERHSTVDVALRYVGLGAGTAVHVATDDQARMRPDALSAALADVDGPTIVCAAAGNVNSGAFDPFPEVLAAARGAGAWVHVDGAFGLWAAASPSLRHLVDGVEGADSWAVDAHKWLNVPYDSGLAIVAHPPSHRGALSVTASYLVQSGAGHPDPMDLVPEFSRRARGFAVWAALRQLGRSGVAELVDRCCRHARTFAAELSATPGIEVLNDVVLNQVVLRCGDDDDATRAVQQRLVADGTAYVTPTVWRGKVGIRISVSNWRTTPDDVTRSLEALRRVTDEVLGSR